MRKFNLHSPVAILGSALFVWAAGCGSDPAQNPPTTNVAGPPKLAIVPGAPALPGEEPASEEHAIEGYAAAMASDGDLVAVGTSTSVFQVTAAGPVRLEIVGDEPDLPPETGPVRAMAAASDGLLIAATAGVFFTKGNVLQLSLGSAELHPLGITAMTSRIADDDGDQAMEAHVALLAEGGAYELSGGELRAWKVEGEGGAPTAALAQKDRLYLAFGRRVYEVDKATETAYPLVFDIGEVRAIACNSRACDEGSLIYFASDAGLVERSPDGAYTLYPLAVEGEAATPVEGFALDGGKQRLYALAGSQVLRVRGGELPDAVATLDPEGDAGRTMAVDKLGDVWASQGLTVKKLALGTPLSFATDVKPVMHEYCSECHTPGIQGAPKIDFEAFETMAGIVDTALMRVATGTMPPISYPKKLPKEKLQILQDWAVTKAP